MLKRSWYLPCQLIEAQVPITVNRPTFKYNIHTFKFCRWRDTHKNVRLGKVLSCSGIRPWILQFLNDLQLELKCEEQKQWVQRNSRDSYSMERLVRFCKKSRELSLAPTLTSPILLKENCLWGRYILWLHKKMQLEIGELFTSLPACLERWNCRGSDLQDLFLPISYEQRRNNQEKQWKKVESRRQRGACACLQIFELSESGDVLRELSGETIIRHPSDHTRQVSTTCFAPKWSLVYTTSLKERSMIYIPKEQEEVHYLKGFKIWELCWDWSTHSTAINISAAFKTKQKHHIYDAERQIYNLQRKWDISKYLQLL